MKTQTGSVAQGFESLHYQSLNQTLWSDKTTSKELCMLFLIKFG